MTVIQFPVFVKGQTLTDDDLNDLRDSLEEIDRRTGRSIGFGINCGLGGSIAANTPDDRERASRSTSSAMCWSSTRRLPIGLAPTASPDQPPPGSSTRAWRLHPGPACSTTRDLPAPQCNEAGCEGHAKQRKVTSGSHDLHRPAQGRRAWTSATRSSCSSRSRLLVRKTGTVCRRVHCPARRRSSTGWATASNADAKDKAQRHDDRQRPARDPGLQGRLPQPGASSHPSTCCAASSR